MDKFSKENGNFMKITDNIVTPPIFSFDDAIRRPGIYKILDNGSDYACLLVANMLSITHTIIVTTSNGCMFFGDTTEPHGWNKFRYIEVDSITISNKD